jgi:anti-sigma factor (TIGR02949 family)
MKCLTIEKVEDYLSGELSPADSSRLEAHMEGCEACRELLQQEQQLDTLLRSQSFIKAPEGLRSSVLAKLPVVKTSSSLPDWLQALALGLIVTFLGVFFGNLGKPLINRIMEKVGVFREGVSLEKGFENLGIFTELDWSSGLFGGNELLVVNGLIAGVIFCWGLWQMVKALRG